MTILFGIIAFLSICLNVFLGWYAYQAAWHLRDVSSKISIFWAELIEYKKFLNSLMDMHAYQDDGTVKSFVESTKKMLEEIDDFREFCELADILTDEELQIIEEMEEDFEEQHEEALKEGEADEHIREWDRQTVPSKTTGIRPG